MGKTIALFSTKGGTGKTFLVTNLAVSVASDYKKNVCLLDMDLHAAGDMGTLLALSPSKAFVDMTHQLKSQPENVKKENFVIHSAFGIDFLPGVLRPQQAWHLEPIRVKEALGFLQKEYDYLFIDAGRAFTDVFVAILNQANLILLVATPDILSIYQTKWVLDTLQYLQFPLSMVRIVLNRADSLSSIRWQDIRTSLPVDILCRIPSEGRIVGQALNSRVPVVIDTPRSKVALAVKKLASDLITDEKLYIERKDTLEVKIQEGELEKTGEFWEKQGMTEALVEPQSDETDEILILKRRIHNRLIEELNLKRLDLKNFSDAKKAKDLKEKAELLVANLLTEEAGSFISSQEVRRKLVKEIIDEALALGPLEDLLADPTITDIMVNNKNEIYIERNGKIELTSKKFISNDQVKTIIERIIAPIGRRIDESVPMVDARLPDGSRVNAIIPPLSLTGPTLTIRKFRKERFTIEELIGINTLSVQMSEFIKAAIACRKNIIVSGGTGSGKTTVLNVLSGFISNKERIVTIEDAAELKLHQDHWVRLESRSPNIEGKGAITVRELFRNTLRMRPDRIIIGECRGIETLDMLQAMNTGHDGSMTTVHANSTQDVLSRLDSMILMAGIELPIRAIREMVTSAIDLIVHTARLSDGTRKILQITEIAGMIDESHPNLKDIFSFKQTGVDVKGAIAGYFLATGYVPTFAEEIEIKGIQLPADIFVPQPIPAA